MPAFKFNEGWKGGGRGAAQAGGRRAPPIPCTPHCPPLHFCSVREVRSCILPACRRAVGACAIKDPAPSLRPGGYQDGGGISRRSGHRDVCMWAVVVICMCVVVAVVCMYCVVECMAAHGDLAICNRRGDTCAYMVQYATVWAARTQWLLPPLLHPFPFTPDCYLFYTHGLIFVTRWAFRNVLL